VNDDLWKNSGISCCVRLRVIEDELTVKSNSNDRNNTSEPQKQLDDDHQPQQHADDAGDRISQSQHQSQQHLFDDLEFEYENGPLMVISTRRPVLRAGDGQNKESSVEEAIGGSSSFAFLASYVTDAAATHRSVLVALQSSPEFDSRTFWICSACTHSHNRIDTNQRCQSCQEPKRQYSSKSEDKTHLPPTNQMPGTIAVAVKDNVFLSSVHPELSPDSTKTVFKQLLSTFLLRSVVASSKGTGTLGD